MASLSLEALSLEDKGEDIIIPKDVSEYDILDFSLRLMGCFLTIRSIHTQIKKECMVDIW